MGSMDDGQRITDTQRNGRILKRSLPPTPYNEKKKRERDKMGIKLQHEIACLHFLGPLSGRGPYYDDAQRYQTAPS